MDVINLSVLFPFLPNDLWKLNCVLRMFLNQQYHPINHNYSCHFLELIKNFINLEKYCAQLPNFIGDLCFLKLFPFQVVQNLTYYFPICRMFINYWPLRPIPSTYTLMVFREINSLHRVLDWC